MSEMMTALQYRAAGDPQLVQVPIPQPKANQVLVKILGVSTCNHWDLHLMHGEPMFCSSELPYPAEIGKPGHEAVGEIAALGEGVQGWTVGTRVVTWGPGRGGVETGDYADYNIWPDDAFFAMPSNMEIAQAAPLELAMSVQVAFNRLTEWDLIAGRRFAVSGLGPAGLIAVQMAKQIIIQRVKDAEPLEVFETAVMNVKPNVEVRSKRVGGSNYQVPIPVNRRRQQSLAIRWLIQAARGSRGGKPTCNSLAKELIDAFHREGTAMTTRENVHRMAEANKAFSHFAW